MARWFQKKIWTVIHEITYLVSMIMPKSKKIWVFGAWAGGLFSDNAKYMYQYIREAHSEINAVWITKNKDLSIKMREQGHNAYYYHTLKGIWFSLRAKVVLTTAGLGDVAEWAHAKILHVALWHGTPLKKIGYDNTGWKTVLKKTKGQIIKSYFFPYLHRDTSNDIYMVSSEEVKQKFETAFGSDSEHIYVTGQPRNDAFIKRPQCDFIDQLKSENPEAKVICYLPTHRNFGTKDNNPLNKQVLLETDAYLRQHNVFMIFKPHFHELKNYSDMTNEFTNIVLGMDEKNFSDVYTFLPYCDLLISDYSSVYVDFLCSGKPIVLFPYDLDDYVVSDAGLYYDYKEISPGEICYTWEDTIRVAIEELGKEARGPEYNRLLKLFCQYNDGNNCERVYQTIRKELEEKKKG